MTAAMQLHRDACLMQTNLDILDQYALAMHAIASKLLQSTIGGGPYPGAELATAASGTHARRASIQMEALVPCGDLRWTRYSSQQHDPEHIL